MHYRKSLQITHYTIHLLKCEIRYVHNYYFSLGYITSKHNLSQLKCTDLIITFLCYTFTNALLSVKDDYKRTRLPFPSPETLTFTLSSLSGLPNHTDSAYAYQHSLCSLLNELSLSLRQQ